MLLVPGILVLAAHANVLRRPLSSLPAADLHRPDSIDGPLKLHLLSWTPEVGVQQFRIGNPDWAGKGDMLSVGVLATSSEIWPLFAESPCGRESTPRR